MSKGDGHSSSSGGVEAMSDASANQAGFQQVGKKKPQGPKKTEGAKPQGGQGPRKNGPKQPRAEGAPKSEGAPRQTNGAPRPKPAPKDGEAKPQKQGPKAPKSNVPVAGTSAVVRFHPGSRTSLWRRRPRLSLSPQTLDFSSSFPSRLIQTSLSRYILIQTNHKFYGFPH